MKNLPRLKLILPLVLVFAAVFASLPRTSKFPYDYRRGQQWNYETLFAEFDFPVYKTADQMREELYTVVDQGGIVVDVAVENPLYGELRGNLNLASRYDVDHFIQQAADTPECLLSRMTGGVHLHTLSSPTPEALRRIEAALDAKGLLYKKEE